MQDSPFGTAPLSFIHATGVPTGAITLLKKRLTVTFKKALKGGHDFEPPRLMARINRGGQFLFTEAVKTNQSPRLIDLRRRLENNRI